MVRDLSRAACEGSISRSSTRETRVQDLIPPASPAAEHTSAIQRHEPSLAPLLRPSAAGTTAVPDSAIPHAATTYGPSRRLPLPPRRSARRRRPGRTPNSTGFGRRCPDWKAPPRLGSSPSRPVCIGLRNGRCKVGASGTARRRKCPHPATYNNAGDAGIPGE